jgi:hypothetical protein
MTTKRSNTPGPGTRPRPAAWAALALASAAASCGLSGCGGDETSRIKLVPVSGTVTLNGKPLEGAEVTFTPDAGNAKATPGSDVTGPEGNFKVIYRGRSGLAPGKYKVLVSKLFLPAGVRSVDPTELDMVQVAVQSDPEGKSKRVTPPTQIRGEFDREVPPEGGPVDIDVKGKPGPLVVSHP